LSVLPPASNLKSATDDQIASFNREPQAFTTAAVRHDTIIEFNLIGKAARIINDDATNNLTVRLHSNRGIARVIPPSSELTIREWYAQIHIEPDGTTGTGVLELEVAEFKDVVRDPIRRGLI